MIRYIFFILTFFSPYLFAEEIVQADPPKQEQSLPVIQEEHTLQEALPGGYESAIMKMLLVFVSLVLLIFLSIWFLRRFSRGKFTQMNHLRNIKVLEKRPLSPKTMLYFVEVSGKKIVLSESQLEVRALTTIEWTEEK